MQRIVLIAAMSAVLAAGFAEPTFRPVAVSLLADGQLLVLSPDHLDIADPKTRTKRRLTTLPVSPQWLDMVAVGDANALRVFAIGRGGVSIDSPIVEFDRTGKEVRRWTLSTGFPSGIGIDPSKQTIYVAELLTQEIFRIQFSSPDKLSHYLTEVDGAKRLGPLTVNGNTGELFVGDVFSGRVSRLAPPLFHAVGVATDLGEPSALAVSPNGRVLYVADRSQHCAWSIRLDVPSARPVKLVIPDLREPTGIIASRDGTVWIGDYKAEALFGLTTDNKIVTIK